MTDPRHHLAAALLAFGLLPMAHATTPQELPSLRCQFQVVPRPDGQVALRFQLTNPSQLGVHLLRWGSPFESGWFGPFVKVTGPAGELAFQGAMRKRGEPAAQDYLNLPPRGSLTAEVLLNDAFALPASGELRVSARWHWHDVMTQGTPPRPRDQHQGQDQDCGSQTLRR